MVEVYVPKPGEYPDFDRVVESTWQDLERIDNPEGITLEAVRTMLARRMVEFGGQAYTPTEELV